LLTTPNQTYQFADNVSYNRGKHAFKFGGEFRHGSTHNVRDRYGKGRIKFASLKDFLAGVPSIGRLFIGDSERNVSLKSFGGFVQDDWRVSNHFTINAGVRYDLSTVIKERNNLLGNFDPNVGLEQVGSQVSSPYSGDHNNFAPRLGIIWDPTGSGKTVIRAGSGITYEIPHISTFIGQNGVNNASTAGLNVIPTGAPSIGLNGGKILASSVDTSNLNWSTAGPVFNAIANCSSTSPCNILGVNRNLRTPYVTSWNLNVQHAFTSNLSLQLGYVGSKGTKLYSVYDINQIPNQSAAEILCGHCEANQDRPFAFRFPYLGVINYLSNGYESKYNGLQATLTQRAWRGITFVAGYTWAHALDQASLNRAQQPQDSTHPGAEYASSDLDIRHRLTLSMTCDIPGRDGFAQMMKGWQINSIVTLQTGLPWSVVDGFSNGNDASGTAEFSDRWNFYGNPSDFKPAPSGIPYFAGSGDPTNPTSNSSCNGQALALDGGVSGGSATTSLSKFGCYADRSSFMIPPPIGTFGTMGRILFRGPGYRNWDFSITKNWTMHERLSVQLRGEFSTFSTIPLSPTRTVSADSWAM
jgi:hypothetical protein